MKTSEYERKEMSQRKKGPKKAEIEGKIEKKEKVAGVRSGFHFSTQRFISNNRLQISPSLKLNFNALRRSEFRGRHSVAESFHRVRLIGIRTEGWWAGTDDEADFDVPCRISIPKPSQPPRLAKLEKETHSTKCPLGYRQTGTKRVKKKPSRGFKPCTASCRRFDA